MVHDKDVNKDVFLIVDGQEYLCGKWIAKIDQKYPLIDALLIKFTDPGVVSENNAPGGKTNTISLDMDTALSKKYMGQKVQKYCYKTGLTYGTIENVDFILVTNGTSSEPATKRTGVILVVPDNDKFLEFGECGALLTTTPDDSGKVVALGVLFGRVHVNGRKYVAYPLAEVFNTLKKHKMTELSKDPSHEPFYDFVFDPFSKEHSEATKGAAVVFGNPDSGFCSGFQSS